jgi:hypothetical protein
VRLADLEIGDMAGLETCDTVLRFMVGMDECGNITNIPNALSPILFDAPHRAIAKTD